MGSTFSLFINKKSNKKVKNKIKKNNILEDYLEDYFYKEEINCYFKPVELPSYSEIEKIEYNIPEYYKPKALYPKKTYLANEFILR